LNYKISVYNLNFISFHLNLSIFVILGEQRSSSIPGNARSSCERARISGLGGTNDHTDNMDNPSSREDISEMYVSR